MKNLVYIFSLFAFAAILVTSCEYEIIRPVPIELPPVDTTGGTGGTGGPTVFFAKDIQTIFNDKNCNACHKTQKPILTEGNAYNNLISGGYINTTTPEDSKLYVKVKAGHPGGSSGMNATQQAYLLQWIKEGAQNN